MWYQILTLVYFILHSILNELLTRTPYFYYNIFDLFSPPYITQRVVRQCRSGLGVTRGEVVME